MKIVVLVRTLNEERNIEKFCQRYSFCDEIIISDGGSTDRTVEIAKTFDNVTVHDFHIRIPFPNGEGYYTHEGKQINGLIRNAVERGADWVIYEDCDCYPNFQLGDSAREILDNDDVWKVMAYRLYIYKRRYYFPDLNKPGQGLWAWRPDKVKVVCDETKDRHRDMAQDEVPDHTLWVNEPLVLLHNYAQDDEHIKEKLEFYRKLGIPVKHPKKTSGKLKKLPKWADV